MQQLIYFGKHPGRQTIRHIFAKVINSQDTRYKIFYFPIMEPSSTEQNNHLQIKEHKIHMICNN